MGRSLKIHDFVFSAALLAVLGGCNGVGQSQLKRPHLVVEPIASTPAGDDLVGLWTEDCRTVLGAGGAVVSASRRSLAFRPGGEFILYTTHFRKTGCEEPLFSAFESGQVTFQGPYLSGDATAVDFELKEGGFVLHSESGLGQLKDICPRVDTLNEGESVSRVDCDGKNPRQFTFHTAFRTEPAYEENILKKMLLIGGLDFVANSSTHRGDVLPALDNALLQVSENPNSLISLDH